MLWHNSSKPEEKIDRKKPDVPHSLSTAEMKIADSRASSIAGSFYTWEYLFKNI